MARIPRTFIDDLLARVNIGEVIGERIALKPRGRELLGICPFHDDSKPSLSVAPDKGVYLCRACNASGNAIGFLMEFDGLGFVEAIEALAASAGLEVPREGGEGPPRSETAPLYDLMQRAAEAYVEALASPEGARARRYLAERGVNSELIARFGIGYAPGGWDFLERRFGAGRRADLEKVGLLTRNPDKGRIYDRFRDRVMFPIRDGRGRVVGFGGRIQDADGSPKYLNSPETPIFQKRRELYGLHEVRASRRKFEHLVLVEGYMDVIGLASRGIDNAVAVLGTAVTEHHFRTLFRTAPHVVCCFDGDAAGRAAAWRALEAVLPLMEGERQASFLFLPSGDDPDSFVRARGAEEFTRALGGALSCSEFLFRHAAEGLDLERLDDRAVFKERADRLIARVPVGAYRDLLQQRARQLAGLIPRPARRPAGPPPGSVRRPRLAEHGLRMALGAPEYAAHLDDAAIEQLRTSGIAGADALANVLEMQRAHPGIGRWALIGRCTGTPLEPWLRRALALPQVESSLAEFEDVVRRLSTHRRPPDEGLDEARFARLLGRLAAQHGLHADGND